MKVGIALNMLSEPPRPDMAVVSDHLAMGDLAEPLGFDVNAKGQIGRAHV